MCTDVDRNDKSRVCEPGTVKVIGRRLIETYAGLFHTVDHVEGFLKEGFDSLDAFLSHMWAVTVIGAPKKAASVAVENLEKDARGWYGGAVGVLSLNGDINTGIVIRTTYLRDGIATYPPARRCSMTPTRRPRSRKPASRRRAFSACSIRRRRRRPPRRRLTASGVKLLLVDNETVSSTRFPTTRGRPAPKW